MTRSGSSGLIAAASARAVSRTSAPASWSSLMRTPRSAPIDNPLRMASLARSGPIETSTTSRSRASVLSDSRTLVEFGSGTCLTVTTIFTRQPLSLRREIVMKALVVLARVEASKQIGVETFQPGDVEPIGNVRRLQAAAFQRGGDRGQR